MLTLRKLDVQGKKLTLYSNNGGTGKFQQDAEYD